MGHLRSPLTRRTPSLQCQSLESGWPGQTVGSDGPNANVEVGRCRKDHIHLFGHKSINGLGVSRLCASVSHFELYPQHLVGPMEDLGGAGEWGWCFRGQPGHPPPISRQPAFYKPSRIERGKSWAPSESSGSKPPPTTSPSRRAQ